jgi:hypothetical protein
MKCPSFLYPEATNLNFFLQKAIYIVFSGCAIIHAQRYPSDESTTPSETQIDQHEEFPFKGFPSKLCMILASSRTYKKQNSNSIDLAELQQKPFDHRQIPIDLVLAGFSYR